MTDEENTMSEVQNVLETLSKRLDDADEAEAAVKAEDTEKAMKEKKETFTRHRWKLFFHYYLIFHIILHILTLKILSSKG